MARGRSCTPARRDARRDTPDLNERKLDLVVRRVFFRATDSDYVIALCDDDATGREIVIKGELRVAEGDRVRIADGEWKHDARYGWSFRVNRLDLSDPVGRDEVIAYLKTLDGIGTTYAEAIVHTLGPDCLARIDADPGVLAQVKTASGRAFPSDVTDAISANWKALRGERDALLFLYGLDLPQSMAARVYAHLGSQTEQVVREDPWALTAIPRVSFRLADRIGRELGLPGDHPSRLAAGSEYVLSLAETEGHTHLPRATLASRMAELLGIGPARAEAALDGMIADEVLIAEDDGTGGQRLYAPEMFAIETAVYDHLHTRLTGQPRTIKMPARPTQAAINPTDEQWAAVQTACAERLSIITGGPGVGKTTVLDTLCQTLDRQGMSYVLAAPTGKAARRMTESVGRPAHTIHRLLGFAAVENPLGPMDAIDARTVIVDEASMLDLRVAERLLAACGPKTNLVLVGDPDQLPPVGAGNLFGDLIDSGRVPTARLTRVFRQAEGSLLIVNAHRAREGKDPFWTAEEASQALGRPVRADWEFHETDDVATAMRTVIDAAGDADAMVVSPQRSGGLGVHELNRHLQAAQNPSGTPVAKSAEAELRVGDQVLVTRNDYRRGIVNGDTGRILDFDRENKTVDVEVGEVRLSLTAAELVDLCQPGFALTVHKSQGSQAATVVCPLSAEVSERLVSRNLVYTAWTRASERCVVVGTKDALRTALSQTGERHTAMDLRVAQVSERLEARRPVYGTLRSTLAARGAQRMAAADPKSNGSAQRPRAPQMPTRRSAPPGLGPRRAA